MGQRHGMIFIARSLALSHLLFAMARADLAVTLELVAASEPQASPLGFAVNSPRIAAGSIYFTRTDHSGNAPPNGIYRDGTLILPADAEISGHATCCGPAAMASDGSRLLISSASTFGASNGYQQMIALLDGNTFTRILDRTTPFAGYVSPRPRNQLSAATIDGNDVAVFISRDGSNNLPSGIARYDLAASQGQMIVLEGDEVPGGGGFFKTFPFPTLPVAEGGRIVFRGEGTTRSGLYEWTGASLRTVVDTATPLPEGGGNFLTFHGRGVAKDGGDYAFTSGGPEGLAEGVYKIVNGTMSLVANPATTAMIFPEPLTAFADISLRKGKVVFSASGGPLAFPPAVQGIYTDHSGSLEAVVDLDTDFGGRTPIYYLLMTGDAWETDDSILFQVEFDDHTSAIYRARLGEGGGNGRLDFTVEFHGPRRGTITVLHSRVGFHYTLRRSLAPGAPGTPLITLSGTGAALDFTFDDTAATDSRAFFVVEETE